MIIAFAFHALVDCGSFMRITKRYKLCGTLDMHMMSVDEPLRICESRLPNMQCVLQSVNRSSNDQHKKLATPRSTTHSYDNTCRKQTPRSIYELCPRSNDWCSTTPTLPL
jgi:hypothetical protein